MKKLMQVFTRRRRAEMDVARGARLAVQSRRLFLASAGAFYGCVPADGRGAGVPLSEAELEQRSDAGHSVGTGVSPEGTPSEETPSREAVSLETAGSLGELEQALGGRVGVFALLVGSDDQTGKELLSHRADEHFAMCSTFKWGLAAAILEQADGGKLSLREELAFGSADIEEHAPFAKSRLSVGKMTVLEACAAAVSSSDNTATNLLLDKIGGPTAVTEFFRSVGDSTTRLDRREPELNANLPDDQRDTTSPRAMAQALWATLGGDVLSVESRALLTQWLVESRTGDRRVRAGLPEGLTVGGKTGTGARGACNDVVIAWPSSGPPLLVSAYLSGSPAPLGDLERALQRIGELVSEKLG